MILLRQKAFASEAAYKVLTNLKASGKQRTVKRKIGYDDEERASVRLRLDEMVLDDENSVNEQNIGTGAVGDGLEDR